MQTPRIDHTQLTPDLLDQLDTPLIVQNWPLPPRNLPPEQLKQQLHDETLWIYDRNAGDSWQEMTAEQFVTAWIQPQADPRLNVVDVYLPDPHFDAIFPVHAAFDANNVLLQDDRTRHYRRSVVLSAPGAYTPMHVDGYGCGGWMYLIEGQKLWELVHPDQAMALWDAQKRDFRDAALDVPETAVWTATLQAGELLICPPGFVHRVQTPVRCTGFGGAYLPRGQVPRALEVWHREQAHGVAGPLDFASVLAAAEASISPAAASAKELDLH